MILTNTDRMNVSRSRATIGDKSSIPNLGNTRRIGARIGSVT